VIAALLLAAAQCAVQTTNQTGGVTACSVGSVVTIDGATGLLPMPAYNTRCLTDRGLYVLNGRGSYDRTRRFLRLPPGRRMAALKACEVAR
jgi:hypothetical protein